MGVVIVSAFSPRFQPRFMNLYMDFDIHRVLKWICIHRRKDQSSYRIQVRNSPRQVMQNPGPDQ